MWSKNHSNGLRSWNFRALRKKEKERKLRLLRTGVWLQFMEPGIIPSLVTKSTNAFVEISQYFAYAWFPRWMCHRCHLLVILGKMEFGYSNSGYQRLCCCQISMTAYLPPHPGTILLPRKVKRTLDKLAKLGALFTYTVYYNMMQFADRINGAKVRLWVTYIFVLYVTKPRHLNYDSTVL